MPRPLLSCVLACVGLCWAVNASRAQTRRLFNDGDATLGGRTAWSDELIFYEWRIQQHAVLGNHRLLDPDDRRVVQGSYLECFNKLLIIRQEQRLAALPKEVVILVHGLGGYRHRMQGLGDHLARSGYAVLNFGYASTQGEISLSAKALASVVRNLKGVESIDFVAHSMGNLVIRRFLHDVEQMAPQDRPAVAFKRMVMISPPNHGADILDNLENRKLAQLTADQRGGPYFELSPDRGWAKLEPTLATPDFEFGVIVGGRGDDLGYFSEIPGDDDGLLTVATSRLDGAADYLQTGGAHWYMTDYQEVRDATVSFLRNGYFVSAETREPVLATR